MNVTYWCTTDRDSNFTSYSFHLISCQRDHDLPYPWYIFVNTGKEEVWNSNQVFNISVPFDRKYFLVNFCYQVSRSCRYPCRFQPSGAEDYTQVGESDGKCRVGAGAVKQNGVATRSRWFTANYTAFKGKSKPKYWSTTSSSTSILYSTSFIVKICISTGVGRNTGCYTVEIWRVTRAFGFCQTY